MKATELKDKTPVEEIVLKITDIKEPTQTRVGMVQQADAEDDSGSCTITLWNEHVGQFAAGDTVVIEATYREGLSWGINPRPVLVVILPQDDLSKLRVISDGGEVDLDELPAEVRALVEIEGE